MLPRAKNHNNNRAQHEEEQSSTYISSSVFGALQLLFWQQEGHSVCKSPDSTISRVHFQGPERPTVRLESWPPVKQKLNITVILVDQSHYLLARSKSSFACSISRTYFCIASLKASACANFVSSSETVLCVAACCFSSLSCTTQL